METLYPRERFQFTGEERAALCVCERGDKGHRLIHQGLCRVGGGGSHQTFLEGMTGIKTECVCVCVRQKQGVHWGCLSVLVDRAGDCSQIQLIPSGCVHLSSTSDEKQREREP